MLSASSPYYKVSALPPSALRYCMFISLPPPLPSPHTSLYTDVWSDQTWGSTGWGEGATSSWTIFKNALKISPVYICKNDKPMTSLALSTAHQVNTSLCQPHSLKGCHIFVIDLSKTCHPQFLFYAVDGSRVPI